ncbi:MAG: hypothetical protein BECKG1743D_GA0114223_106353 [Candidatus Kentron sp. G]|nr:MAG: hypothetical protein BECKG1743D_GA0114223_106353 [Candidatus Kentron sp. G]
MSHKWYLNLGAAVLDDYQIGSVSDLLFLAAPARTAHSRDRRVVLGKKGARIEKDAGYKSAIPDPIPIGWQQICNTTIKLSEMPRLIRKACRSISDKVQ